MSVNHKPQPLVKWVGGKRQLLGTIVPKLKSLADFNSAAYFEPFFGGGAVLFELAPKRAFASDINVGLVNLYHSVRAQPNDLFSALVVLQEKYNALPSMEMKQNFYAEQRQLFNSSDRIGLEMAARFVFLNKAGFNGMYRENAQGGFNIPFGKRDKLSLGSKGNLLGISELLAGVNLELQDYAQTVQPAKQGDVVYFDPPYIPLTATSSFTTYTSEGFDDNDQVRLRDLALALTAKGVRVLLSNSSAPRVSELYAGFQVTPIKASRNISATSSGRVRVDEFLISNESLL